MYFDEFREIDCKYVAFKRAAVCIAVTMVVKWMVATVHSNSWLSGRIILSNKYQNSDKLIFI